MGPLTGELFIDRTLHIIEEYEKTHDKNADDCYDVTLWTNCLFGLILIPGNKMAGRSSGQAIPAGIKDTLVSAVDKSKNDVLSAITFVDYIIGLRNALAHLEIDGKNPFAGKPNGELFALELSGDIKNHSIALTFKIDLEKGKLDSVVKEILSFVKTIAP